LILLECCTINIYAADISLKVIPLQLKGYTPTEWQFHVAQQQQHPYRDHWTEASVGINSLIFLKDGKPAFLHPPPSQNRWLIEITPGQLVYRTVKKVSFTFLHT
jgi:hypothetical protein